MNDVPLHRSVPSDESTRHFDPLLRPELHALYVARAARLRQLAQGHELEDYLRLAADVAESQSALSAAESYAGNGVDPVLIARQGAWSRHLDAVLDHIAPKAPAPLAPHLATLRAMSTQARTDAGILLAQGQFHEVPAAIAPFLWAALSAEVALAARAAGLPPNSEHEHAHCPVCGSTPVASLIHTGRREGLRYLHCAMCECEWHVVRAKCTNCGDAGQLDYLSFDTTDAVVRAESCGKCHSFLKVVSQVQEPTAETVADDLASLVLDDAATAEGYGRTGLNPFALPYKSS